MPKRGFYRKSARHPESSQKRALTEAGYTLLYTEGKNESVEDFIASLRKNEVFGVTTLGRLASSRERLRDCINRIFAKGAVIHELSTGRRSTNVRDIGLMVVDAADELAADRRVHSPADARKYGRLGGRPSSKERMPDDEARVFWYNVKRYPKPDEALAQMTGFSKAVAYKRLGGRLGVQGVGRPRKSRK